MNTILEAKKQVYFFESNLSPYRSTKCHGFHTTDVLQSTHQKYALQTSTVLMSSNHTLTFHIGIVEADFEHSFTVTKRHVPFISS